MTRTTKEQLIDFAGDEPEERSEAPQNTEKVSVDKKALHTVLTALNGQPYYIRELQATRSLHALGGEYANPIDILIEQFNAAITGGEEST